MDQRPRKREYRKYLRSENHGNDDDFLEMPRTSRWRQDGPFSSSLNQRKRPRNTGTTATDMAPMQVLPLVHMPAEDIDGRSLYHQVAIPAALVPFENNTDSISEHSSDSHDSNTNDHEADLSEVESNTEVIDMQEDLFEDALDIGPFVLQAEYVELDSQSGREDESNSNAEGLQNQGHLEENEEQSTELENTSESDIESDATPDGDGNAFGQHEHQPLYNGSTVTLGLAIFMIMSFVLAHHLTGAALQDLLTMLHIFLPAGSLLPQTKFLFDNHFIKYQDGIKMFLYCPDCNTLLGNEEVVDCLVCEKHFNKKDLIDDGMYFLYMNIEEQLKQILQEDEVRQNILFDRKETNKLSDIHDGKKYKSLNGGVLRDSDNLSLSMNCDGAPVFSSSTMSIWPVQLIVNELPPQLRRRKIIMAGLWFGKSKPSMFSFLSPFTKELQTLAERGVKWNKGDKVVRSKIFLAVTPVDTVARCLLQNMKQFNGEYGCGWCLNKGERVEKGAGSVRVYDFNDVLLDRRTHAQLQEHVAEALQEATAVFGVKGPSPLYNIEGFDLVEGFPPDCLHAVFLGVARQITGLWLDSANHEEVFYIGRQTKLIDKRLSSVCPTSELTRVPQSVTQRAHWKGYEWRSWLILYCLVVLKGILPFRYLHHLMLLVDSVFTLSMASISKADVKRAHISLNKFVFMFKTLYGKKHMSFHIHQLLHLAPSVKNWGPLWSFSTAWFEGHMGVLLKLFNGTKGVPKQIAKTFKIWKGLQNWSRKLKMYNYDVPADLNQFLDRLLHNQVHIKKAQSFENDVHLIGVLQIRDMTLQENYAAQLLLREPVLQPARFYNKCISKGVVLHSASYRETKRVNYYVQLDNGESAVIKDFALVHTETGQQKVIIFINFINFVQCFVAGKDTDSGAAAEHIKTIQGLDDMIRAVTPFQVTGKYAIVTKLECQSGRVIAALPNLVERD